MYFEGRTQPDGFDNLGFARAEQIRALFWGCLDEDDRVRIAPGRWTKGKVFVHPRVGIRLRLDRPEEK